VAKAPGGRNEPVRPIIVKKITVVEGGHHGGAWKVAYADFVTAMMAFFLLMWLLGATTEKQRKGIADYFTPTLVNVKHNSAGSYGLLGGSSLTRCRQLPAPRRANRHQDADDPARCHRRPQGWRHQGKAHRQPAGPASAQARGECELARTRKQVHVSQTPEGIRVDLMDDAKFSMFRLGTTLLTPKRPN